MSTGSVGNGLNLRNGHNPVPGNEWHGVTQINGQNRSTQYQYGESNSSRSNMYKLLGYSGLGFSFLAGVACTSLENPHVRVASFVAVYTLGVISAALLIRDAVDSARENLTRKPELNDVKG
ncbi:hypothetical protein [Paraburkholderia bonniea]|uniref:hypothetical protein n=1 Tax=Paraburkholderia bonniea TaxID=2152891 RepID=UPI00129206EA|nr:hypothetical protein [Paraburkholderia bonniea]